MAEDDNDLSKKFPGGEHLTFTDKIRAGLQPITGADRHTGRPNFPREEFLRARAAQRKREFEESKRRK